MALSVFNHAVQEAHVWVDEVASEFEGWNPQSKPVRDVTLSDFAIDLQTTLGPFPSPYDVEVVARAVFAVIGAHISEGEWDKLARVLPRELSTLWMLSGA